MFNDLPAFEEIFTAEDENLWEAFLWIRDWETKGAPQTTDFQRYSRAVRDEIRRRILL